MGCFFFFSSIRFDSPFSRLGSSITKEQANERDNPVSLSPFSSLRRPAGDDAHRYTRRAHTHRQHTWNGHMHTHGIHNPLPPPLLSLPFPHASFGKGWGRAAFPLSFPIEMEKKRHQPPAPHTCTPLQPPQLNQSITANHCKITAAAATGAGPGTGRQTPAAAPS